MDFHPKYHCLLSCVFLVGSILSCCQKHLSLLSKISDEVAESDGTEVISRLDWTESRERLTGITKCTKRQ